MFFNKNKIDENEFNKAPIKLNNLFKVYLYRKQNGLTQGLELKFYILSSKYNYFTFSNQFCSLYFIN